MNVLLLSTGGGGGNIVRSVKALFHRDLAVTQRADPAYAERLRTALMTCCLDTNEFSLADLPPDEKLLIGARTTGRLGARHNPDVARAALAESKSEVEALISRHAVIILVGTGGKGTGAGTIYVLWDLSQVDPSDLSTLFAGHGRLRIGFAEIDPPAGQDPTNEQVEAAVRHCWENPFYMFGKPAGTSLICIQGNWSNVVDARIKGRLATLAMGGAAESPYNPLFARAVQSPRPWGVTVLFAEHTGAHAPLEIEWPFERDAVPPARVADDAPVAIAVAGTEPIEVAHAQCVPASDVPTSQTTPQTSRVERHAEQKGSRPFASLWEFAVAVNRSDPAALALASNGAHIDMAIDGTEVRKLVGTLWFRGVAPKLSQQWRTRLLDALVERVEVANHSVRAGRRTARLSDLNYGELQELSRTSVPDVMRTDLDFLLTAGRLFGGEAIHRLRFADRSADHESSKFMRLVHGLRRS